MEKILFLLLSVVLLASCHERRETAIEHVKSTSTYLDINDCKYYKVNLNEHDIYQYIFPTSYGIGSDILHIEDMCEKCKTEKKLKMR